jgi:hypothetical protein
MRTQYIDVKRTNNCGLFSPFTTHRRNHKTVADPASSMTS